MVDTGKSDLRQQALAILLIEDAAEKAIATRQLTEQCRHSGYQINRQPLEAPDIPGRPTKPELVNPKDLPRRRNNRETGHASLIHAICHIE
ncbi:MAG: DUF455 family protein, partial [Methylophaga sp.]|nr:DUF455 family protein [Methylophaga sp.]